MLQKRRPGVLIIVENLTVPLDRRVWQEACALRDAGYTVSVICPKGGVHKAPYELLEGIHIFRHPLPVEARGPLGYLAEYSIALFYEFVLSVKAHFKVGFDTVQACNPPDLIFLIGAFWKYLFGKPFVFDHHDINPELYEAKFGRRDGWHRLLHKLERMTFRVADAAIATNETFREIAIERGGMDEDRVFIVRSVPDTSRFRRVAADPSLKNGRKHLVGFVGIMGAQDGVDLFVEAMNVIVHEFGRNDVQALIIGTGTELPELKKLASERSLDDAISFPGFLSGEALLAGMSTFDVGIIPDPKNVYNDKISMNKVLEYMTLGIPFVQFDLVEGRKMAAGAALYASGNCPRSLAEQVLTLLDDPDLRRQTSAEGIKRAASLLRWDEERKRLLAAYELVLAPENLQAGHPVAASARSQDGLDPATAV
ncbi:MAG: glycosyltransferase family 4 protein [Hyphomicrobium sp.]|nr:glycosyltransferase family 4 protein [Hyphomicrobium sp.]